MGVMNRSLIDEMIDNDIYIKLLKRSGFVKEISNEVSSISTGWGLEIRNTIPVGMVLDIKLVFI